MVVESGVAAETAGVAGAVGANALSVVAGVTVWVGVAMVAGAAEDLEAAVRSVDG